MKRCILVLLLAALPGHTAEEKAKGNAVERVADKAGGYLGKTGKAIERGAKATAKAAERPRAATQKFLEKTGKKINEATEGK
jgi:hypothetical protein